MTWPGMRVDMEKMWPSTNASSVFTWVFALTHSMHPTMAAMTRRTVNTAAARFLLPLPAFFSVFFVSWVSVLFCSDIM